MLGCGPMGLLTVHRSLSPRNRAISWPLPGGRAGKRARPRQHPAPADCRKSVDKTFANTVSRVQEFEPVRVMHVDLDYVYDPDPAQQTKTSTNSSSGSTTCKSAMCFSVRFRIRGATAGSARSISPTVVFRSGPIFNFARQLQTRAGVKVFAWMPVLSFDLSPALPRSAVSVKRES